MRELMKISEASITIKADGFNRLVEYPEMPMVELIAELFRIYGTSLEIKLPEAKKIEFENAAKKEWHNTRTDLPQADYIKLWVDKETDKYFAIQHAHKAFNDYVFQGMEPPKPAPELFPGTTEALGSLTIRPDADKAV